MLVKANGLPRITTLDLYCEILGNLLAREFGIETPEPFIVRIDTEFVQAIRKPLWEKSIMIKAGLGVGCEYYSQGFTAIASNMFLSKEKLEQAIMIYGFDLLTQNPDRREANPNCALKGNKIIAFDFEKSLSFLFPILGQQPEAWELSKLKLSGDERHVFKSNLKAREKEINWQPLIEKMKRINTEKLEEICSLIPLEFGNYTDKICGHFASIMSNSKKLELELQRSLL
ncbi:MAG: hypothetical protein M3388_08345 [Acidobacteriota bacterium]|nr:hypothetical protein [Acidobacteriota bacterium]